MFALRWSSSCRVQIGSPVAASRPYAFARPSPKYAPNFPGAPGRGPITIPDRTAAFAWKVQIVQPLFASSAYTVPFWLPTNTRPPATVGSARAVVAFGNPNAHFSVSFGTFSALRPAWSAG